MAEKCNACGLPENRTNLCDRWDCPQLSPCCKTLGPPVPYDMVGVTLDGKPAMISRRLAEKIRTIIDGSGDHYWGMGYRLIERKS
jgi:hypothetical protein